MIIVLINWRILPDKVKDFEEDWKTRLRLEGKPGLVGEFLCRVEGVPFFDKVTWEMETDEKDDPARWRSNEFDSFVNVGIWDTVENFHHAVGQYMTGGRTLGKEYEAAPRRRAVLSPEHWRRGEVNLPTSSSPGVLF